MPPFLRVNAFTIPVATEGTGHRPIEIGSRGRGFGGRPRLERRATFERWTGRTTPQDEQDYLAIQGAIRGLGQAFPYDANLYSHSGLGHGSTVGSVRPAVAEDGNTVDDVDEIRAESQYGNGSMSADSGVTNLLPTAKADLESLSGVAAVGGATLALNANVFFATSKSVQVSNATPGEGVETTNESAITGSPTTYGVLVHVYTAGIGQTVDVQLMGDVSSPAARTNIPLTQNQWTRIYQTAILPAGNAAGRVRITKNTGTSSIQVDALCIATQVLPYTWVDGSRATATLRYSPTFLTSRPDVTIAGWLRGNVSTAGDDVVASVLKAVGDEELSVFRLAGSTTLRATATDANGNTSTVSATGVFNGTWKHFAVSYRRRNMDDEQELKIYAGGAVVATDTGSTEYDTTAAADLDVGHRAGSAIFDNNQLIDDLIVAPYAMTTAQIAALFGMSQAMSPLPLIYVDGDQIPDNELTVLALGQTEEARFVGATVDDQLNPGTPIHRTNLRALNYALNEWGR